MAKIALYTMRQCADIIADTGVLGDVPHRASLVTQLNNTMRRLGEEGRPLEARFGEEGSTQVTLRRHRKQYFKASAHEDGVYRGARLTNAHSIVVNGVVYDAPVRHEHGYIAPLYVDISDEAASMQPVKSVKQTTASPVEHSAAADHDQAHSVPRALHNMVTHIQETEQQAHSVVNDLHNLVLNVRETERQARELAPPSITASLNDADAAWAAYREDHRALSELANEQLLALGRLIYANEAMVLIKSPHRPKDT